MEGTTAPIKEISRLCLKYDSKLLIDEAHAFGVMGSEGRGESFGLKEPISIISGTFGKAFGGGGAFKVFLFFLEVFSLFKLNETILVENWINKVGKKFF